MLGILYAPINMVESIIDNCFRDMVKPIVGSVLYCDLAGFFEHSGIYVGNNEIVHLDGNGDIELASPNKFLNRLNGWNLAFSIYVSSQESHAVGGEKIAQRARNMLGKKRDYSLMFDNCHQFTAGCINGDFESHRNHLWMLKNLCIKELNCDSWRVWNREGK